MQLKHVPYIVILVLLVALYFSIDGCSSAQQNFVDEVSRNQFLSKRDSVNLKKIEMQANVISTMKQNVMSEKAAKKLLKEELEGYKRVNSFLEAKVVNKINNLSVDLKSPPEGTFSGIEIDTSGLIHKDTVDKYFLRTPSAFNYSDDWASINGFVERDSVDFNEISFTNELDVTIGRKKGTLFKKGDYVVDFKSYSPYANVPYVNNVVVKENKTTFEKIFLSRPACFVYGLVVGRVTTNI